MEHVEGHSLTSKDINHDDNSVPSAWFFKQMKHLPSEILSVPVLLNNGELWENHSGSKGSR